MKPDETVDVNISGLPLFEVAKFLNSVDHCVVQPRRRVIIALGPADIMSGMCAPLMRCGQTVPPCTIKSAIASGSTAAKDVDPLGCQSDTRNAGRQPIRSREGRIFRACRAIPASDKLWSRQRKSP